MTTAHASPEHTVINARCVAEASIRRCRAYPNLTGQTGNTSRPGSTGRIDCVGVPKLHLDQCHSLFLSRSTSKSFVCLAGVALTSGGRDPSRRRTTDGRSTMAQRTRVSVFRVNVGVQAQGRTHHRQTAHQPTRTHMQSHGRRQREEAAHGEGDAEGGGAGRSRWRRRGARSKRSVGTGMCRLSSELGSAKLRRCFTTSENPTCCFEVGLPRARLPDWPASESQLRRVHPYARVLNNYRTDFKTESAMTLCPSG